MPDRATIALACPQPGERASVAAWLAESGYAPVLLADLTRLDTELQTSPIEALVADAALLPRESDVSGLLRRLGVNRPLVMLGDHGRPVSASVGTLSVVRRPLTRDALLLSVGLALAEGRPARRFARRAIEPVQASAHGVTVTIREASERGVGIEFAGARPNSLPPYFSLRIPEFGVLVVVKRAWVVPASATVTRCGGTVEGDLPGASKPWAEFAREAPDPLLAPSRFG